jgi:CheY-like chemotaxis protein
VRSVLIIEDDEDVRELQRAILESEGFEVRTARNGRDGLLAMRERRPSVIVLDLMMPVMDGLTFLQERNKLPDARWIPVVCVSAAGPQMIASAVRFGARECLQKPVDVDAFCDVVGRYCAADSGRPERT